VAAKHAVVGLTRSAALDHAAEGLRVNAVCPGYVETPLAARSIERRRVDILARVPLRRIGTVGEIAELVVWLCSDRASFVTGESIAADGGPHGELRGERMRFEGKVAVVTGAANGLGLDAARAFAREGARVLLVDCDPGGEAEAAALRTEGHEVQFHAADVTQSAEVAGYVGIAMREWGAIHCFFNNAGIEGHVRPIVGQDEAMFDSVMAVNVKGVFLGLRHVLPVMIAQGVGAVVNTASTAALVGSPGLAPYVGSKHAVLGITRAWQARWRGKGSG
jgi:NAD(P)-dependent dehydrogenase (short-subunit alcohol dehydrogenase family)